MLRGLSPGDIVLVPEPFFEKPWNQAIVTEVSDKEIKLFRLEIVPHKVQGNDRKIIPFLAGHETIINRKSDVPIQIIQKVLLK